MGMDWSDERGGRVMFVSHCLLNQNVRYPGGAFRAAMLDEVVEELRRHGVGLIQMPCPEQAAWGGIPRRALRLAAGLERRLPALRRLAPLLLSLFRWHTRRVYARLAEEVARQAAECHRAGVEVLGVLGIDGSPSCGVSQTLALNRSYRLLARLDPTTGREQFNSELYERCLSPGPGLFTSELMACLARRGLPIPFHAHSLVRESLRLPSEFSLDG